MADDPPPGRVYITGALGFIGRTLAERYRGLGAEVGGVDVRADPAAGVSAGDISAPGAWQGEMTGCDLVIHTAALVSNAVTADASWRLNVMGTRHALDGAAAAGVRGPALCAHLLGPGLFRPRLPRRGRRAPPGANRRQPLRRH